MAVEQPASRDAHTRCIEIVTEISRADGRVEQTKTARGYTEIASGLHFRDASGQWQPAVAEPVVKPDGTIAFERLATRHSFAVNANLETVVTALKEDGTVVRSAVAGLAYIDRATGQSAVFASPRDSVVQVHEEGVYYPDAFEGVDADILYKVQPWGMEQDLVIYGNVPPPEWFGLARENAVLCVLTELIGLDPAATVATRHDKTAAEVSGSGSIEFRASNGESFETFHSGYSWIEEGALDVGASTRSAAEKTPVSMRTFMSGGRTFLAEEVPFTAVEALNDFAAESDRSAWTTASLPPARPILREAGERRVAGLDRAARRSGQRLVLDYATYASITNDLIFRPGETYYISGFSILDGPKLTVGPGSFIKFHPSASMKFINGTRLECRSHLASPAIFTTAHDANVGESITNFTGDLAVRTNWFNNAFEMTTASNEIQGVDIRYSIVAVAYKSQNFTHQRLRDVVFRNCDLAVEIMSGTSTVRVENVLFRNCNKGIYTYNYPTLVNHSTFEAVTNYGVYTSAAHFSFTNNLFSGVTNKTVWGGGGNPTSGAANARWNSAANWLGDSPVILTSSPFAAGLFGSNYLYQASSWLVESGRQAATFWKLYHYTTSPSGEKETNSVTDIGFHYGTTNDADGDGLYDFVEDAGGDGSYSSNSIDVSDWLTWDTDGDGLNDGAEYTNYFTSPRLRDTDGDGSDDGAEVNGGSDPLNTNSFLASVSGSITYTGRQTGLVWVIAATTSNDWSLTNRGTIVNAPGAFTITNLPTLTNYWIKAFRDANGSASNEAAEAQGVHAGNPVYIASVQSGLDIALAEADSDQDGIPDWWEILYAFNPTSSIPGVGEGWWKFDEGTGTNVGNAAGTNYGGRLLNMPESSWTTGRMGGALLFDGLSNYVHITQQPPIVTTNQFTVSAWVQYDAAASAGFPSLVGDAYACGGGYPGFWLEVDGGGQAFGGTVGNCTDYAWPSTATNIAGDWRHVAMTLQTSSISIYIDGVLRATATHAFTPASRTNLFIGWLDDPYDTYHWKGRIDDVRVYTSGLGSNAVHTMYDALQDPDGDGLSNLEEYSVLTDPALWDTDGDGMSDLQEVAALGSDPLDPGDGEGLLEEARRNIAIHWAMIYPTPISFTNASGSAADLADLRAALTNLQTIFYEVQAQ